MLDFGKSLRHFRNGVKTPKGAGERGGAQIVWGTSIPKIWEGGDR